MIIVLNKVEHLEIKCNECPRCHKTFNLKNRKRTKHHALPKFMKSKSELTIELCKECHEELNSYYNNVTISTKDYNFKSDNFNEFLHTYNKLKKDFEEKKLNRAQFGSGLWSNLISYLKSKEEEK